MATAPRAPPGRLPADLHDALIDDPTPPIVLAHLPNYTNHSHTHGRLGTQLNLNTDQHAPGHPLGWLDSPTDPGDT